MTSMNTVRTGLMAYMGISESVAATRAQEERDMLSLPRAYASCAFGRGRTTFYDFPREVKVTYVSHTRRTLRVLATYK